jgi:hypothetical protein
MSRRMSWTARCASLLVFAALAGRSVTVHSVGAVPEIHRVRAVNNDLESVEGLAPPGSVVELWYRQRSFKEGAASGSDRFSWCGWKNDGAEVMLGAAVTGANGVWRMQGLRQGQTVMLFPGVAGGGSCAGGVYTELLPRVCDESGCTAWETPTVRWLNVTRHSGGIGTAAASIEDALWTSVAVADGPNDGPEPSSVFDVDENGIDTTKPGLTPGQLVTWKCGSGGTSVCPSIAIWDATTVLEPDPEFPFVLGTLQGHRPGGSVFAAAAIKRGSDLGFAVNVNVRFRGTLDVNLGCDQPRLFDFSVPLDFAS